MVQRIDVASMEDAQEVPPEMRRQVISDPNAAAILGHDDRTRERSRSGSQKAQRALQQNAAALESTG